MDRTTSAPGSARIDIAAASVLTGVAALVGASPMIGASASSEGSSSSVAPGPDVCLEADASLLDVEGWGAVHRAIAAAVEDEPEFFPDAAMVSFPDLTQSWVPSGSPTVRIGIWGTGGNHAGWTDVGRERIAGTDCLSDGADWPGGVARELVVEAAVRMLAVGRRQLDGGEPLVPTEAEADIDVEFHPAERRVRTILDWSKPVLGPIRVGGLCWIDDVLGADVGEVTVRSQADMDVTIGGEAGCALFQEFLDERGGGERAVDLLPTEVDLADGYIVSFVVETIDLDGSVIVMAGSIGIR